MHLDSFPSSTVWSLCESRKTLQIHLPSLNHYHLPLTRRISLPDCRHDEPLYPRHDFSIPHLVLAFDIAESQQLTA